MSKESNNADGWWAVVAGWLVARLIGCVCCYYRKFHRSYQPGGGAEALIRSCHAARGVMTRIDFHCLDATTFTATADIV